MWFSGLTLTEAPICLKCGCNNHWQIVKIDNEFHKVVLKCTCEEK